MISEEWAVLFHILLYLHDCVILFFEVSPMKARFAAKSTNSKAKNVNIPN